MTNLTNFMFLATFLSFYALGAGRGFAAGLAFAVGFSLFVAVFLCP